MRIDWEAMGEAIVITGIGMLTPLGDSADEVLRRIAAGETAAVPAPWPSAGFACPVYATIPRLVAEEHVPEPKTVRLMSREAILAVGAARRAMKDANLTVGKDCASDEIGLFGATGLAGMTLSEIGRLVEAAADQDGSFDLKRFGAVALKQVRPVLSFKILSNMPLCFVSIFEGIQGVNAVYNPWEGQAAHAIAAAISAVRCGDASCALVGGCDVKTHELGFLALEQAGAFDSWRQTGSGCIPGEGAAFLVIEGEDRAVARGARIYARIRDYQLGTMSASASAREAYYAMLSRTEAGSAEALIAAGDGSPALIQAEVNALEQLGIRPASRIRPKVHLGNLFAGAATVQVALAATVAARRPKGATVLANCFGFGSEQGLFVLESP